MTSRETELKIVAHIITSDTDGKSMQARLVLKDDEGFHRAVLAVGDWKGTYEGAVENVIRKYEASARIPELA